MEPFPAVRHPEAAARELASREVHVWSLWLDPPPDQVAALRSLLSPDEVERADRFRFDIHRRRFIVGRGILRRMLAAYTGIDPRALRFDYGPKGKPSLVPEQGGEALEFNLSHSEEMALYGVTRDLAKDRQKGAVEHGLGIDVEHLRPMPDAESIAERFFSVPERDVLRAVPAERKSDAFFNCWTRKEAYIKATGDGLSMPLDRFNVTLAPGEPARMVALDGDPRQGERWSMIHLNPSPGYVGAVAIEGHDWHLVCRQWTLATA
jgi:4'-phosphopantetheinyl transferase